MNRNAPIILTAFLLTAGCATTPPPNAYNAWQARMNEGQSLTIRAAVLAAEVFNETYDHTIKELKEDPTLVASLCDKVNEARRLYRKAKSWNLSEMPPSPERPTRPFVDYWELSAIDLPVDIHYESLGSTYPKYFYKLNVITLRGKNVMSWPRLTGPIWNDPFSSIVDGDRVDLDIPDLILSIRIRRE